MRKLLGFLLLAVIFVGSLLGCCFNNYLPLTAASRASLLDSATVALTHTFRGHTQTFCSGVWVSQSVILTAGHCVKGLAHRLSQEKAIELGADPMGVALGVVEIPKIEPEGINVPFMVQGEVTELHSEPSGMHLTRVLFLGVDSDLALLQAINPDVLPEHKVVTLPKETPAVGERVFIVGHPHGLFWTHTEGIIAAYRGDMNEPGEEADPVRVGPFLQIDAAVWNGNSGGGAFNERGQLIGIASFKGDVPHCAFFVHLDSIKAIMSGAHLIKLDLTPKKKDPAL